MTRRKLVATLAGVALVGLAGPGAPRAHGSARDLDRKTYLTFTRPVALPGVELGPGTYVFELPDPIGAFDVVRVSSQDRHTVHFTAYTRVVERPQGLRPGQPISFGEARPNTPVPIAAWWPSGESMGREFIY